MQTVQRCHAFGFETARTALNQSTEKGAVNITEGTKGGRGHIVDRRDHMATLACRPHQWQTKHLRWYLVEKAKHLTPNTRYRHWLTVRSLVLTLSMAEHWLPLLQGPWLRPTGEAGKLKTGRPIKRPT